MKYGDSAQRLASLLVLGLLWAGCEPDIKKIEITMNLPVNSSLSFDESTGGVKTVSVKTNTLSWNAVSSDPSWLKVMQDKNSNDGEITVTAGRNTSSKKQEATITITGKGIEKRTIQVSIAGAPQTIHVSDPALVFEASGQSLSFTVESNTDWEISCDTTWLKVTPARGSNRHEVTVTAEANKDVKERETDLIVRSTGGQAQAHVQVKQAAADLLLHVSKPSLNFSSSAGHDTFIITSNTGWDVTSEDPSWLTVSPAKGSGGEPVTITATVTANNSTTERKANITVRGNGMATTQTIVVTQQAATAALNVSPTTLTFSASRATQTVTVTSNIDWTVGVSHSWLSIAQSKGSFAVTAEAHTGTTERKATITVRGTGVTAKTIEVTQSGVGQIFDVSPASLTFSAERETKTLTITTSSSWTISSSSNSSWLIINPLSSSSSGGTSVTAEPNPTLTDRFATLTVRSGGASKQINVTQKGIIPKLEVSPLTPLTFPYQGNTQTLSVSSNIKWSVESSSNSATWLTVSQASDKVTVTAIANHLANTRNGTLTFRGEGITSPVIVAVVQNYASSPFLFITEPPSLSYSASEETKSFMVSSNTTWTVKSNVPWLIVSPTEGSNVNEVTVRARINSTALVRTGKITFSGTGISKETEIIITQQRAP